MGGRVRVLCLNDDGALGDARSVLEDAGFEVDCAGDRDRVRERIAEARPDCVLGVCEPDRVGDGAATGGSTGQTSGDRVIELVEAIGETDPDLPVVLVGDGDPELAARAAEAGVSEYVPDPTAFDRIVDLVDRAVASGDPARDRRRTDAHLAAFFEHLPDPAIEYEFDGEEPVVLSVNRAFTETFGYDRAAIVGEPIDDVIVPEGREAEARALDERVKDGELIDAELSRKTTDGVREFLFRNISVDGEAGPDGYAVYTDVTEQKERERALQERNDRLDEFASAVSHDLRAPLAVVKNRIEMSRQTGDLSHLRAALDSIDRMDDLLRDLLQLARQGEKLGRTEPLDLASVAERAWSHVATGEAELVIDTAATIEADEGRLMQLLENLYINAVENAGPAVTVRVGSDERSVFVEDDGPGIPPEKRERVFKSGYTTDDGRTGYGLTIVREVARAHGWDVAVTEGSTGGARFEFRDVAVES